MKSKTSPILFLSLILTFGYLAPVTAVTDAEIEALEKQIQQLESKENKQIENEKQKRVDAEAKRKAELKRNKEAEAKSKAELENQRVLEEKRLAEEKEKQREAKRLAELEKQRQEDEIKKKAEEEAQKMEEEKLEQFSQHMKNGDSAIKNKEYMEALRIYTQALEIFPSNSEALTGQSRAREFQDICAVLVGEWEWSFNSFVIISADGNLQSKSLIPNHGKWECTDPTQRKFTLRWVVGKWVDRLTLSTDGNTLNGINNIGFGIQGWRKGTKEFDPSREVNL